MGYEKQIDTFGTPNKNNTIIRYKKYNFCCI